MTGLLAASNRKGSDVDSERTESLQVGIARDLVAGAPDGWEEIRLVFAKLGGFGSSDAEALLQGQWQRFRTRETAPLAADLQEAMYQPGKGTWFSLTCRIQPGGSYGFEFNHDQPVDFTGGQQPLPESWAEELRRHPRPPELVPDWVPAEGG